MKPLKKYWPEILGAILGIMFGLAGAAIMRFWLKYKERKAIARGLVE